MGVKTWLVRVPLWLIERVGRREEVPQAEDLSAGSDHPSLAA